MDGKSEKKDIAKQIKMLKLQIKRSGENESEDSEE